MPRLDIPAVQAAMLRRRYLFKHQLANMVGIPYGRLALMLSDPEHEVEEEDVRRLCAGLECERAQIVAEG